MQGPEIEIDVGVGECTAKVVGLGNIADGRTICCRVEALSVAVGAEASGRRTNEGRKHGGEERVVLESWLPIAVGQNRSRQESGWYLLRRRSDDGSEKILW